MARIEVLLLALLFSISVYGDRQETSQGPLACSPTINSPMSIHLRWANASSIISVNCGNRAPLSCFYYSPYKTYMCRADANAPCEGPYWANIDGECCDMGSGCPQKPVTDAPSTPTSNSATLETRIANLQSRLATVQAALMKQANSVNALGGSVSAQRKTLTNFQGAISQNYKAVGTLKGTVSAQTKSIAGIRNTLKSIQNTIDTQGKVITSLKAPISNQGRVITVLSANDKAQGGAIAKIQGTLAQQGRMISKIQAQNVAVSQVLDKLILALKNSDNVAPPTSTLPSTNVPSEFSSIKSNSASSSPSPQLQQSRIVVAAVIIVLGALGLATLVVAIIVYRRRSPIHANRE